MFYRLYLTSLIQNAKYLISSLARPTPSPPHIVWEMFWIQLFNFFSEFWFVFLSQKTSVILTHFFLLFFFLQQLFLPSDYGTKIDPECTIRWDCNARWVEVGSLEPDRTAHWLVECMLVSFVWICEPKTVTTFSSTFYLLDSGSKSRKLTLYLIYFNLSTTDVIMTDFKWGRYPCKHISFFFQG